MNDNPILRPVENAEGWTRDDFDVSGRESNPHLLVFTRCSVAVELPSSITEAQRPIPKGNDGQGARWESISCPMVRGLNTLAVSRFTDNPNSTARRNWRARWESNPHLLVVTRCSDAVEVSSAITEVPRPIPKKHDGQGARWESISCPMVRGLNALAVSRFTDNPNSSAHRNWGDQPDSHRHKRLHGA